MANSKEADRRAIQEQAGLAAHYLVKLSQANTEGERKWALWGVESAVETARLLSLRFIGLNQVEYPDNDES